MNRRQLSFNQFDIYNYYASISPMFVNKALIFARGVVNITDLAIKVLISARNTMIEYDNKLW